MSFEEKVSIIIPVYNIQEYVGRCINSIIHQTYSNIEIIIVDDGSTDNSGSICDEYKMKDNRIRVIHKRNGGLSSARNAGIEIANGELLSFVDGDDWVDEKYIETLVLAIKETDAMIACCACMKVYDEKDAVESPVGDMIVYSAQSAIENLCYLRVVNCSAWGKVYRKELFYDIRFPVGKIFEDMAVAYKLFDKAKKITYVSYLGYFYFHRNGSILHSAFNESKLERMYIADDILKFIKDKYLDIINSAYCRCLLSYLGVYKDMPFYRRDDAVWNRIKTVRKYVVRDTKCPWKIRMLALVSYSGKLITKVIMKGYSCVAYV